MITKNNISLSRILLYCWLFTFIFFVTTLVFATNFFTREVQSTLFGNSVLFIPILLTSFILGSISFLLYLFSLIHNKHIVKVLGVSIVVLLLFFSEHIILISNNLITFNKKSDINFISEIGTDQITSPQTKIIEANIEEIIDLTNMQRLLVNLKPLKENTKLNEAALIRANTIIQLNEWSHEEPKTGITYTQAIKQVNYWNVNYGENLARDYYTSDQAVSAWMNSPKHKENILNPNFQEIGIGIAYGIMDGVDTPIIVQLFGGYQPPNYKESDIIIAQNNLDGLKSVQSGWVNLKMNESFYNQHKTDIDRINEIISIRIPRLESILITMRANKYYSSEQNRWIVEDQKLYNEQDAIASKLNTTN